MSKDVEKQCDLCRCGEDCDFPEREDGRGCTGFIERDE
jgi:hypothetical protein